MTSEELEQMAATLRELRSVLGHLVVETPEGLQALDEISVVLEALDRQRQGDPDPLSPFMWSLFQTLRALIESDSFQAHATTGFWVAGTEMILHDITRGSFDGVSRSNHATNLNVIEGTIAINNAVLRYHDQLQVDEEEEQSDLGIPPREPAPVEFTENHGRVAVRQFGSRDSLAAASESTRRELLALATEVSDRLARTNHRNSSVFWLVQRIKASLEENGNPVALGVLLIALRRQALSFRDESEEIAGELDSLIISVDTYLSQFPDWVDYQANAANSTVRHLATRESLRALEAAETQISRLPQVVADPEVRQELSLLRELADLLPSPDFSAAVEATIGSLQRGLARVAAFWRSRYAEHPRELQFDVIVLVLEAMGQIYGLGVGWIIALVALLRRRD